MSTKKLKLLGPCALVTLSLTISATRIAADDKAVVPTEIAAGFEQSVKPFLNQHCLRCHNEEKLTSGVRVDGLDASVSDSSVRLWEGIRRQIVDKAMPPEDEPQPTPEQQQRVLSWIETALQFARSRPVPKNGSARRLTVAQYRNTLRELLQLEDDLAKILPPDAVSRDGFLNNQETLLLSPLLLETYFEIAEQALHRSIVDPKLKPTIQNFRVDLGASINSAPCPDPLILGANSLLLNNADFIVSQPEISKPFEFTPFAMQTKFRFIEGYAGNDTVRGWREYDSIYHAVFACMRGTTGYPKGQPYSTVPQGLLLRPAIPSEEIFEVESTYGPRANFKISLRELPDHGRFRVTVRGAKYADGLLLERTDAAQPETSDAVICNSPQNVQSITIERAGVYQVDILAGRKPDSGQGPTLARTAEGPDKPQDVWLRLGEREFAATWGHLAFLAVRLEAGELPVQATHAGTTPIDRLVFTPLDEQSPIAQRFLTFEKRVPRVGVHVGLRRDCGSTLTAVGEPQAVTDTRLQQFVFEGAIQNFPSPDVEKDNVNYLAGIREISVRSEFTDGRDMPRLLVRSVEFEGPLYDTWPPESHRRIFIDSLHDRQSLEYAREVIIAFATRAYRRPVSDAEAAHLIRVFETSRSDGNDFLQSVKNALLVVLTSPQFLFLIEQSSSPAPEPLDEHEIASKLAYFLWNGPPDEQLLKRAEEQTLLASIDAELDRLIADPRFEHFTTEFVTQWLALDKFAVLEPSRKDFPDLTRDVRTELQREPIRFFQHLVRTNQSVRKLVDSEFIVANEVVASYYGLGDRIESGFNFVPLTHGRSDLGGVVSQAAIMAGLSDGRESNPVKRGAWFARRIIGEPPADPPPNVPALAEEESHLSLRERLEQHRNQAGCFQCHTKIDPWGIPFEQYDAGGRFKSEAVDARSTLPDQTEVTNVGDLKRYLVEDRLDQVAFSMLKHLAIYAIGRNLTYPELEFLQQNSAELKANDYPIQDMIRFLVKSELFLEK